MRLIQHKREAWWFYRFLSLGYDDWVNPLFWTERMRAEALTLARLDRPDLETLDAGAGTGFTTEGIVERVSLVIRLPKPAEIGSFSVTAPRS
jgi:MPBQ/MSBQ methyltransferase